MADPIKVLVAALLVAGPLVAWQDQQRRIAQSQADAAAAEAEAQRERARRAELALEAAEAERVAKQTRAERDAEAERARRAETDRKLKELRRLEAEVRQREAQASRLVAEANGILYRLPAQALLRTIQAAAIASGPDAARARAAAIAVLRERLQNEREWATSWRQITAAQ